MTNIQNIDRLLSYICATLQLPNYLHNEVETRYNSVAEWLEKDGPLSILSPRIYSQGSYGIGTTIRPLKGDEFDLDFVLEVNTAEWFAHEPVKLLDTLEARLEDHGKYAKMLSRKNRCVRISYANDFHMDIIPAVPSPLRTTNSESVLVPDTKLASWSPSNPVGYKKWFTSKAKLQVTDLVQDSIEPLETPELAGDKSPLKRSVQLIKRWRDLQFETDPDSAPISIVLTTLFAKFYNGSHSTYHTILNVLERICQEIQNSDTRIIIKNPTNSEEDFSEKWNDFPQSYEIFVGAITELRNQWRELPNGDTQEGLSDLFGAEVTTNAINAESSRQDSSEFDIDLLAFVPPLDNDDHAEKPIWSSRVNNCNVVINARVTPKGSGSKSRKLANNQSWLPNLSGASFRFTAKTDVDPPFVIKWQVVNTGKHAKQENSLRGGFVDGEGPTGAVRTESATYTGKHWVACFVIKDDVIWARSERFFVNIVNLRYPRFKGLRR